MTQPDGPVFEGVGYSARRLGSAPDTVAFRIAPREWDGAEPGLCAVRIVDDGDVIVDRDIAGTDPLQALELALGLVRRFVVQIEPDEEYLEYIAGL